MKTETNKKAAMLRKQTIGLIAKKCMETMQKNNRAVYNNYIDILENGKIL